jgi:hypothetical protein
MTDVYDYSDSTAPIDYELIPAGEVSFLRMHLRPGGSGEDGLLKRSKDGSSEYLDVEFTLLDGAHARMKFWQILMVVGETDGQKQMVDKSKAIRKAILDSAYGIHPDDKSVEARAKRSKVLKDFEGLKFQGRIGIERGKSKNDGSGEMYRDRNVLDGVITPDKPTYRGPPDQDHPSSGDNGPSSPSSPAAASIAKPEWAKG